MVVKDIRVPQSRSVNLMLIKPREQGPLYTFPPFGLLGIGVAGVALGNAGGALRSFEALARAKKNSGSSRTLSERQVIQSDFAKAQAAFRSARAYLVDEIENTWGEAKVQGTQSVDRRAALRLACTHMTRVSAEIARTCYELAGGAALYETNDLQRRFRDAHAITQHIVTAPATYELLGRVMFGLPTQEGMI
jgi:alkylation response protein AidB-like acyl-CoA dehydrogenase